MGIGSANRQRAALRGSVERRKERLGGGKSGARESVVTPGRLWWWKRKAVGSCVAVTPFGRGWRRFGSPKPCGAEPGPRAVASLDAPSRRNGPARQTRGMLGTGRGVGGQLLPAPGPCRAKQNQAVSCDLESLVGEPSLVGRPARTTPAFFPSPAFVTPKAGRLFSPSRSKYHCPQSAKGSSELGKHDKTRFSFFMYSDSESGLPPTAFLYMAWRSCIRKFSLVAILFLLSNQNHSSSAGNLSPQPGCWHQQASSRQRLRSSVSRSLIEFIRTLQDKSLLIEF